MSQFFVEIEADGVEKLRALEDGTRNLKTRAARKVGEHDFRVPALLTEAEIAALVEQGYSVHVGEDADVVAGQRKSELVRADRFEQPIRDAEDLGARTVLGYLTVAEIDSAISALATSYPSHVAVLTLPHPTWEGRTCRALRLRAGSRPTSQRVGVYFTGGVHAREWGGPDICIQFCHRLLAAYAGGTGVTLGGKAFAAANVRAILERLEIFVFPLVNPDGRAFSQSNDPAAGGGQGTWWRKNRNPNGGSGPRGVDLNRNFDFLWSSGIGTSTSPASFTYKGTAAFSEPESRNVRHLLDSNPHIRYYVDIHSFGRKLLYSWGDDDNQIGNLAQNFQNPIFNGQRGVSGDSVYREFIPALEEATARSLAVRMQEAIAAVRGTSYEVQQAVGLYPTSGTSDDYAFCRHFTGAGAKVYGYTVEFGDAFVPTWANMLPVIDEIDAAMLEMCAAATAAIAIRDNPTDAGAVPISAPFWDSPDAWVRNNDDGGTVHQNTIRGRDNFVYVRVHNRGSGEARHVEVQVMLSHFAGTQFVYPHDYAPRNPSGAGGAGTPGTTLIGRATITSLAAGASQVVRVPWPRALIPTDLSWHPCLLIAVAPEDGLSTAGPHVYQHKNLGQKNLTIVSARRGQVVEFPFHTGNAFVASRKHTLQINRTRAPASLPLYFDSPQLPAGAFLPGSRGQARDGDAPPGAALLSARIYGGGTMRLPAGLGAAGDLLVRLPANATVALGAAPPLRATTKVPKMVNIGGRPRLKLPAVSQILLALPAQLETPLATRLRVDVPTFAAPGTSYRFDVMEKDARGGIVGGVALEVRIVG